MPKIPERLLDAGLVLVNLLVRDLRIRDIVLQQRYGRFAVVHQVLQRIVALRGDRLRVNEFRPRASTVTTIPRRSPSPRHRHRRKRARSAAAAPCSAAVSPSPRRPAIRIASASCRTLPQPVRCQRLPVAADRDLDKRIIRIADHSARSTFPALRTLQFDQSAAAHHPHALRGARGPR